MVQLLELEVKQPEPERRGKRSRNDDDSNSNNEQVTGNSDSDKEDSESEAYSVGEDDDDESASVHVKISQGVKPATASLRLPTSNSIFGKRVRMIPATHHDWEKLVVSRHENLATISETLVPIRLETETNGVRVRDVFLWNLNEVLMSPEKFTEYTCVDLGLPPSMVQSLGSNVRAQIDEFRRFLQARDFPVGADTRVIIKLDLFAGKVHLKDRFEWDLDPCLSPDCTKTTPEQFARILVSDLGLGGEFVTMVAHSIREQLNRARRDFDNEEIFPIEKPLRAEEEAKGWCPIVETGGDEEEEDTIEMDRQTRYAKNSH